jgi:hypothetical protein
MRVAPRAVQAGQEYWRRMALADEVSLLAATKRIMVAE